MLRSSSRTAPLAYCHRMQRGPLVADHTDVNLWDPATFAAGIPYDAFATLRIDAPVAWHTEPARREGGREGPGFWLSLIHI